MFVPFDTLPSSSRVWIYPASRPFREEEIESLEERLLAFVAQWTAHGTDLQASYRIVYRRFLILALNEDAHAASGCSIDASVHFIQQLENDYDLVLLDKMNVTYRQGDFLAHKSLADFKKMAKDRAVTKNTVVFNNLVLNKEELETLWEVPAHQSWHARFF